MKFPEKLWLIVDKCTSGAISWDNEGDAILIEFGKFKKEFLGQNKGFKTKNVVSFVRQLNLYGFRKCNKIDDVHIFQHQYFIRGRQDLLMFVRRTYGYSSYSDDIPAKLEEKENFPTFQKQVIVPQNSRNDISKDTSQAGPSNPPSRPLPVLKDSTSFDSSLYGWWGNAYHPVNSMFYPRNSGLLNGANCTSITSDKEFDSGVVKVEMNSYWENLGMYNNVVFVPVPAPYGLHPGILSGNLGMTLGVPSQPYHLIGDSTNIAVQEPEDNVSANCTGQITRTNLCTPSERKYVPSVSNQ